jgi:hypothetical protein
MATTHDHPSRRHTRLILDWLMVAWVLGCSFAYLQGALAQRFPQYLGWLR